MKSEATLVGSFAGRTMLTLCAALVVAAPAGKAVTFRTAIVTNSITAEATTSLGSIVPGSPSEAWRAQKHSGLRAKLRYGWGELKDTFRYGVPNVWRELKDHQASGVASGAGSDPLGLALSAVGVLLLAWITFRFRAVT